MTTKLTPKKSSGVQPSTTDAKLSYYLSWIIAGILVLLPFHALITTWIGSNTGHLDLIRIWKEISIVLLIVPAGWLVYRTPSLRAYLKNSWIAKLFVLYIILHLGLGYWALSTHRVNSTALIYSLLINLRFVGFFLLCLVAASRSDFLYRNWRKILTIPALIVVGFGLLQKFALPYDFLKHFGYGPKTIPAYQTVDSSLDYRRVQSSLRGANPLGAYLILTIPTIYSYFQNRKVLRVLGVLASLIVLVYSYSRSAWAGLFITVALLVWWGLAKKPAKLWVLGTLAVVVIAAGSVYLLRSNQTAENTFFHTSNSSRSATSSNQARANAIKTAALDVWHDPLGGGPGTAGPASFRNTGHPTRIAENYYLQIAQEVGVVGLAIFVAINLLLVGRLWQQRAEPLSRLLLASLIGISFVNLISHAWTDDTLSLLWWGLAGIAIAPLQPAFRRSRKLR